MRKFIGFLLPIAWGVACAILEVAGETVSDGVFYTGIFFAALLGIALRSDS